MRGAVEGGRGKYRIPKANTVSSELQKKAATFFLK
jgi:hypothetical protein